MSNHAIPVDEKTKAADDAFLKERASEARYIKRHSKQARWTHGITVICCKNHCYIIFFTFFCNFTDAFINYFAGFFSCC